MTSSGGGRSTEEPIDADGGDRSAQELGGVSVVVTRAVHQSGPLSDALAAAGAVVVAAPAIEVVDPSDGGVALAEAVDALLAGRYLWVVVTSANGAQRLVTELERRIGGDGLPGGGGVDGPIGEVRFASVGPATTARLADAGLTVSLEAYEAVGDSLVERFEAEVSLDQARTRRVLIVRAETGRPTVPDGLARLGWDVDLVPAYAVAPMAFDEATRKAIAEAEVITFASGRTAGFIVDACGVDNLPPTVVCIGPVAAAAATELGLEVAAVADPHTTEGLVASVIRSCRAKR